MKSSSTQPPDEPASRTDPQDFAKSVGPAIERLRNAVAEALEERGLHADATPTRIARDLSIDTKLGWKLANLVGRNDPFEAGQYVPGAVALGVFLEAAQKRRVKARIRREIEDAGAAFAELVRIHGGTRSAFDMLLAGQTREGKHRFDLEHRRRAFEANGYLLGVQAEIQWKCFFLWPSNDDDNLDAAILSSFLRLRRLRSEVPWRLRRTYSVDDEGDVYLDTSRRNLDDDLARFGTLSARDLERIRGPEGQEELRLGAGPVGRTAESTLHTGEILRAVEPRYRSPRFAANVLHARLQTPVEHMIFDVFVREDLFAQPEPSAKLYSDLFSDRVLTRPPECDRLELIESLEQLGTGSEVALLDEIPDHAEILGTVFEAAGQDPARYLVHRIRLRHPPTPTVLFVQHELKERESRA